MAANEPESVAMLSNVGWLCIGGTEAKTKSWNMEMKRYASYGGLKMSIHGNCLRTLQEKWLFTKDQIYLHLLKRSIEASFKHHQWSLEEWPTNKVSNKIIVDCRQARGARGLKYDDSDSDTSDIVPEAGNIHCNRKNIMKGLQKK